MAKNNITKKHTTNRDADTAKAGKRAGTPVTNQPKAEMGKVKWVSNQVLCGNMHLEDALDHVKANEATEREVLSFLRFCVETKRVNPVVVNKVIGYIS